MSLEKAESYLKGSRILDHVIELKESTATVALAAEALGRGAGDDCENDVLLQENSRY